MKSPAREETRGAGIEAANGGLRGGRGFGVLGDEDPCVFHHAIEILAELFQVAGGIVRSEGSYRMAQHQPCDEIFRWRVAPVICFSYVGILCDRFKLAGGHAGQLLHEACAELLPLRGDRRGARYYRGGGLRPLPIRQVEAVHTLGALFVVDLESVLAFEFSHHPLGGESAVKVVIGYQIGDETLHWRHASTVIVAEVHKLRDLLNPCGVHLWQGLHYLPQELRAKGLRFLWLFFFQVIEVLYPPERVQRRHGGRWWLSGWYRRGGPGCGFRWRLFHCDDSFPFSFSVRFQRFTFRLAPSTNPAARLACTRAATLAGIRMAWYDRDVSDLWMVGSSTPGTSLNMWRAVER